MAAEQGHGADGKDRDIAARLRRLRRAEAGATSIEYAMIAAGISVFIILAVNTVGETMQTTFYDGLIAMFAGD